MVLELPNFRPRIVDGHYRFPTMVNRRAYERNKRYCPYRKQGMSCSECRLKQRWVWDKCHKMHMWGMNADEGHNND